MSRPLSLGALLFLTVLHRHFAIFFGKAFDATLCVDELLASGEERVTVGADLKAQLLFGRSGFPGGATRAANFDLVVFRMNICSHRLLSSRASVGSNYNKTPIAVQMSLVPAPVLLDVAMTASPRARSCSRLDLAWAFRLIRSFFVVTMTAGKSC